MFFYQNKQSKGSSTQSCNKLKFILHPRISKADIFYFNTLPFVWEYSFKKRNILGYPRDFNSRIVYKVPSSGCSLMTQNLSITIPLGVFDFISGWAGCLKWECSSFQKIDTNFVLIIPKLYSGFNSHDCSIKMANSC